MTLVGEFYAVADSALADSEEYKNVEAALAHYELIKEAVTYSSAASDCWEMIQSAIRDNAT